MDEDEDEDLTADMEDPTPENSISEVKINPNNAGKADMQPSKGASTYMDMDEAEGAADENSRDVTGMAQDNKVPILLIRFIYYIIYLIILFTYLN
jgi:hypothetical protein